ncbi:MAG: histidine phosphatase family protein [Acidimicrobiia bacterium]
MLQLVLMRHGKSDWDVSYGADHERPLAERGVRSARLMGRLLTDAGQSPDLVVASTAVRAHRTALLAAESGGWDCDVVTDRSIYGGSPRSVLDVVRRVAGPHRRVLVVGHEPTWSNLVYELVGARVEMKTASVAGVGLLIDEWSSLPEATGWLDFLIHPKMFPGGDDRFDSD